MSNNDVEAKNLWNQMFVELRTLNPNMSLEYFVGFSHALSLLNVISSAEFRKVQQYSTNPLTFSLDEDDFFIPFPKTV